MLGWYIPTRQNVPPRWVLAVANGHVLYSRSGESHLECQERTMQRWIRDMRAERQGSDARA